MARPAQTRTPTKDPATLTPRGLRRRAELIDAARTVFERDGFVDTRIADIADEASIAHGTFYIYFDSKEAVFRAVITAHMDRIREDARIERDQHPNSALAAIAAANRSYATAFKQHHRLMLLWEQVAGFDPTIDALLREQVQFYIDRAERSIRSLQKDRLADPELDAAYAAQALCGMVLEFCTQWFATGKDYDIDRAVDTLTTIWARGIGLLHGAPHRVHTD